MCDILNQIEEILPELIAMKTQNNLNFINENTTILEAESGTVVGNGYVKTKSIAVAHWMLTPGTKFASHIHVDKTEYLFVYQGALLFSIDNEEKLINADNSPLIVKPNIEHSVINTIGQTLLIGVTMPADKGYPDVR